MNTPQKIYEGAIAVHSCFRENVTVGADSYIAYSSIGNNVQINRRNIIDHAEIGNYTYTGANTVIKQIQIGKYCSISWNVSMTGNDHNYSSVSTHPFSRLKSFGLVENSQGLDINKITIENDVWVGANAVILPGIKVADGAVIGAGSIVTRNVPAYAIVVGNPGTIVKYRFDEQIRKILEKSKWWNWPDNVIKENISLFQQPITSESIDTILQLTADYDSEN